MLTPKTKKRPLGVVKNKKTFEIIANNRARVYSAFFHIFYLFLTADKCLQLKIKSAVTFLLQTASIRSQLTADVCDASYLFI